MWSTKQKLHTGTRVRQAQEARSSRRGRVAHFELHACEKKSLSGPPGTRERVQRTFRQDADVLALHGGV